MNPKALKSLEQKLKSTLNGVHLDPDERVLVLKLINQAKKDPVWSVPNNEMFRDIAKEGLVFSMEHDVEGVTYEGLQYQVTKVTDERIYYKMYDATAERDDARDQEETQETAQENQKSQYRPHRPSNPRDRRGTSQGQKKNHSTKTKIQRR